MFDASHTGENMRRNRVNSGFRCFGGLFSMFKWGRQKLQHVHCAQRRGPEECDSLLSLFCLLCQLTNQKLILRFVIRHVVSL